MGEEYAFSRQEGTEPRMETETQSPRDTRRWVTAVAATEAVRRASQPGASSRGARTVRGADTKTTQRRQREAKRERITPQNSGTQTEMAEKERDREGDKEGRETGRGKEKQREEREQERLKRQREHRQRQSYRGAERDRRGAERTKRERQRQRETQRDF